MNNALVLDNDFFFGNTLKMFFAKKNITATLVSDGNQAIDFLNNSEYDFIVCATEIAHKSGLEIASYVKLKSVEHNVPFILVTNNNTPGMMAAFEDLKPDAIFHKPVDLQNLLSTISNLQLNTNQRVTVK